ncbi:MAG TPA: DNA-processing protein DprA [Magnetospirillaceae bacterium]|nr:DNA-processing protein DprA [Magnetospirillaceae bacterium]
MMVAEDRSRFRLALDRVPFLRARDKIRADAVLDPAAGLSALSPGQLEAFLGRVLGARSRPRVASGLGPLPWTPGEWEARAERDLELFRRTGIGFCAFPDPDYPPVLRETARPPFLLYWRGRLPDSEQPLLGMVGTRYPTGRGIAEAERLASEAARLGIPVVSGLARGIDAACHRGALRAGGLGWAVLGCGIDSVYPLQNRGLAARIVETGGGLLSEYPPGTEALRYHFPERNRILAGLCRSVLVVEAPRDSGALITADFALEEGRDVLVAAVCLESSRSEGCRSLAADGAPAVRDLDGLAVEWGACPGVRRPALDDSGDFQMQGVLELES